VLWFSETQKLKKTLKNREKPETKWGLLLMELVQKFGVSMK